MTIRELYAEAEREGALDVPIRVSCCVDAKNEKYEKAVAYFDFLPDEVYVS